MMKKILLTLTILLGGLFGIKAQTNMDYELWGPTAYSLSDPTGWGSTNLNAFGGPASTFQETASPGQLLSSVRMVTTTGYSALIGVGLDTLPGMISNGNSIFDGSMGIPYTQKPNFVTFMYKSNPMVNDTNSFAVQLSHWDGTQTVVDGGVFFAEPTIIGTWTTVTLPISYQTTVTPDTLLIIASSSIGLLSGNSDEIPGSEFFVDDVALIICNVTISMSSTDETSPGGNDGTATATPAGGASPYTYLWDDGMAQTTATATGLTPGTYNVTITDANGCVSTASVTINSFTCSMTATATATDETTLGANDGTATVVTSNGLPPYTYSWTGGQTTQTATGLAPGSYTVTVTDANGCTATATTTVNSASCTITAVATGTDETTVGANDGTATITAALGATPYSYLWNDGQTTQTAIGLAPGNYTATVTDANGCTATASYTVNTFTCTLTVTANGTDETTAGANDGTGTAVPSGGTLGYSFLWSDGQTSVIATGLAPGTYTVTVTDANGCTANASVTVAAGATCTVTVTATSTDETTAGASDGTATANAANGTAPYTYSWDNGATTASISGLGPGSYTVTVLDMNGCSATASVIIFAGASCSATVTATSTDETTAGANDGTATATAAGGTAPYTYSWSGGQTTAAITGLSAGSYTVTITDANGCTATASVTIAAGPSGIGINENELVKVYPNPTGSIVTFDMANLDVTHINLIDMNGKIVKAIYVTGSLETVSVSDLPAGIYYYQIMNNSLVVKTDKLSVVR